MSKLFKFLNLPIHVISGVKFWIFKEQIVWKNTVLGTHPGLGGAQLL